MYYKEGAQGLHFLSMKYIVLSNFIHDNKRFIKLGLQEKLCADLTFNIYNKFPF